MDTLSKTRRSWNMSRIHGRDTVPERAVRSLLHKMGFRFRLKSRSLPGKPDVVLSRHRTVVFVHGCFWHRHRGCKLAYMPKSRVQFWERKFAANVRRDRAVARLLRDLGWNMVTVWECELSDLPRVTRRLARAISPDNVKRAGRR
jgi:DNA mismatch endonuclease (patch repair protein)